jgi:hypothetical protein
VLTFGSREVRGKRVGTDARTRHRQFSDSGPICGEQIDLWTPQ